jgi:hypothetical protein
VNQDRDVAGKHAIRVQFVDREVPAVRRPGHDPGPDDEGVAVVGRVEGVSGVEFAGRLPGVGGSSQKGWLAVVWTVAAWPSLPRTVTSSRSLSWLIQYWSLGADSSRRRRT